MKGCADLWDPIVLPFLDTLLILLLSEFFSPGFVIALLSIIAVLLASTLKLLALACLFISLVPRTSM